MKKLDYYNRFKERIDEFLGIKLELKSNGNQVEFIPEFNSKFIKKTLEQIGEIFLIIDMILDEYYEESKDTYFTDLIEEFCQKLISHMLSNKLLIDEKQIKFMSVMKRICNETYESEKSNLNVLFFKKNDTIEEELSKIGLDFIAFDSPKEIEEIFHEKLSLKMLNGENLVLIVGADYRGYGLGVNKEKKTLFKQRLLKNLKDKNNEYLISFISLLSHDILEQLNQPSIRHQLNNGLDIDEGKITKLAKYANEKMVDSKVLSKSYDNSKEKNPYIYMVIKNCELKIYLQNSIDNYLSYRSGKWKLKSFHMLKFLIIEKFYMDTFLHHLFTKKIEHKKIISNIVLNVDVLVGLIKELLEDGKGGLFVILNRNLKKEAMKSNFLDGDVSRSIYRKSVQKDGKNTTLVNHNFEYLKLISKVDGAVTLDNEFKLLSFGRLLKLDTEGTKDKVEGARTAAAISGSRYGLTIKVSEDKHITVWENGIKILEI